MNNVFRTFQERGRGAVTSLMLLLCLPCLPALAQRVRPLPVDEMSRDADVIGVATVVSAIPHLEKNGFVYTDFRMSFSEIWKGDAGPGFVLTKPGGTAQGVKGAIPGHEYILNPGEKIVVFATPSSIGNHVPIGIHQGLYRVGKAEGSPLFRVTQYPQGPGTSSDLTLPALKDDVYRALGKPVESRPAPKDPPAPAPVEPGNAASSPTPTPAPSKPEAAIPEAPGVPRWVGTLVIFLLLTAVGSVLFRKRKSAPKG